MKSGNCVALLLYQILFIRTKLDKWCTLLKNEILILKILIVPMDLVLLMGLMFSVLYLKSVS